MKRATAGVVLTLTVLGSQLAAGFGATPQPGRQLSANDQAPPFELAGSDGRTYRLSDYRGKQVVVLAWFARAFSGG